MLTALQLIKDELKSSREIFDATSADILDDHLHKDPGGKALPLAALYAHVIFSEDAILQGMVRHTEPLFNSSWKNKTGASEIMPPMDENWSSANEKWSHSVSIDMTQFREYAQAVFQSTDDYVNSLADADVDMIVDLGNWGQKTVASILAGILIGHRYSLTGEISAVKGIFGVKGYPF